MRTYRIAILPAGIFGSALAIPLSDNGHDIILYNRHPEDVALFEKTHQQKRLIGTTFPAHVKATSNLKEAVNDAELLILAVPSIYLASFWTEVVKALNRKKPLVLSTIKGLPENTLVSDVLTDIDPTVSQRLAFLSGPNFALEIGKRLLTKTVIASQTDAKDVFKETLTTPYFKASMSDDSIGIQLAGALKNVYAIAAGICKGAHIHDSERCIIITKSLEEMSLMGKTMGALEHTFWGIAGLADLLTCTTDLSRNYVAGYQLGKGHNPKHFLETQTVEGVYTVKALMKLKKSYEISLPIAETTYNVIYNNMPISQALRCFAEVF